MLSEDVANVPMTADRVHEKDMLVDIATSTVQRVKIFEAIESKFQPENVPKSHLSSRVPQVVSKQSETEYDKQFTEFIFSAEVQTIVNQIETNFDDNIDFDLPPDADLIFSHLQVNVDNERPSDLLLASIDDHRACIQREGEAGNRSSNTSCFTDLTRELKRCTDSDIRRLGDRFFFSNSTLNASTAFGTFFILFFI